MGIDIRRRASIARPALKGASLGIAGLIVLLCVSCSSAGHERARLSDSTEGAVSAAQISTPAEIRSLELSEEAGGATLVLIADRSPVWTTYRDSDGQLVVELPNSAPGDGVEGLAGDGLVAGVDIELLTDAERPLTRLVLRTRGESEHSLTTDGDHLRIQLLPAGYEAPVAVAYEPLPSNSAGEAGTSTSETPAYEATETLAAEEIKSADISDPGYATAEYGTNGYGTPDTPMDGPMPEGVVASRLSDLDVFQSDSGTVVQVIGDGAFIYSTFRLQNPERFVIDLAGVTNIHSRSTVQASGPYVDQVRLGQFKSGPDPISRVVFDLRSAASPSIESTANGLLVSFGAPSDGTLISDVEAAASPSDLLASDPPAENMVVAEAPPAEAETFTAPSYEAEDEVVAEAVIAEAEETYEYESYTEPAPSEDALVETTEQVIYEDVETVEVVPAPAPVLDPPAETVLAEAPSVPVYEPLAEAAAPQGETLPPVAPSISRPISTNDIELFEAQEVQVESPLEETAAALSQFDSLIVSRNSREYVGDPISMSLRNADLVETLRTFARISDLNFVIQPGVRGSVTVELNQVPWDQAMEQILKINQLGMEIDGTIVRIAPMGQLRLEAEEQQRLAQAKSATIPLTTVMRSLSYANAQDIAALLRNRRGSILSSRGTVQVDARTNTLILRELPSAIDTVLSVIENLDTPEPQVTIEARIIEATKQFGRSLGIEWGFNGIADNAHGNTTGLEFPNNIQSDGGVALLTGGANGFLNLTLGNILNTFTLDGRLQAAENEGLVNVISAPRVTTLNNQRATIQSGLQIPIQTVSNQTVTVQFVNATLELAVTPHVTAEGTILLDIEVAKREPQLAFAIVGATNAPIATKEAQTKVIVRDGGTAVIGGIYEVTTNQAQDRVPGLNNIPILGHLFRNRSRDDANDELMIFITPRIVQL